MIRFTKESSRLWRICTMLALITVLMITSVSPAIYGAAAKTDADAPGSPVGKTTVLPYDLAGHWAEPQLTDWFNNGWIQGFPDGGLQPDKSLTRGELATLINRAFGFEDMGASELQFGDLTAANWAYKELGIAVHAGYLQGYGDGKIGGGQLVTRQELSVMMTRLLGLKSSEYGDVPLTFIDADQVAKWGKAALAAVTAKGWMKGYADGSFKPAAPITRAELIVALDRVLSEGNISYDKSGTSGPATGVRTVNGDVTVTAPGVILRNMVISGNLTVSEEEGEGKVQFINVTVKETTTIRGGGPNSIYFQHANLNTVRNEKVSGSVRIVLTGKTKVREFIVPEGFGAGSTLVLDQDATLSVLFLNEVINVLGQGKLEKVVYGKKGKGTTFERKPEVEEGGEDSAVIGFVSYPNSSTPTDPVDPTNPTDPVDSPETFLVKDGLPNADIFFSATASDMEILAAEALRDTVKKVSGGQLPIHKGSISDNTISASLWSDTWKLSQAGTYPIKLSLINNRNVSTSIQFVQLGSSLITTNLGGDVQLGAKQSLTVEGSLTIPETIAEGTHTVTLQVRTGQELIETLTLTIHLDRNMIQNGGFEKAAPGGNLPEGWIVPSGARDTQVARTGTSSLRIDLGAYPYINATTEHKLMLERGQEYVLHAWVKGSAPTGQKVVTQFLQMKNDGSYQDGSGQQVTAITDDWTLVELKYTPNANADYDYHWLYFYAVQGTDHLWIDDVTLMPSVSAGDEQAEASEAPSLHLDGGGNLPEERLQIVLGTPDSYPVLSSLFPADLAYLATSDGFAIRKVDQRIYIFGTEMKGVLNGAYDFLEENAGVLWTRSSTTDLGTLYDPSETIKITKFDYREKSPFDLRGFNFIGYGANGEYHEDPGTEAMAASNKINAKMAEFANQHLWSRHEQVGIKAVTLGHNLEYWLPNEEYFADHPDYYNMDVNGEHYIPVADDTQINFYHPDVPGVIAGRVQQYLSEHPIEYVGIGINDNHYFQQGLLSSSPFVTADNVVVQPSDPDYKSTVFFSFLNKIAAQVKVTNPGVKITTFAYFFTDIPPRVKLEDNIVVLVAPLSGDDREPFNTSDVNNPNYPHRLKLENWLQNTKNIIMYNYYGSFLSGSYERPIAEKVQADMKYYRNMNVMGVMPEIVMDARIPDWSINSLQFWLFQRVMWDPDADLEQLRADYIRKAYGAAAVPMSTYYDLIEQGWNQYDDTIAYNTSTNTYIGKYIIEAGIKDAAQAALNTAWSLADAQAKARIAPIKTTFERVVQEQLDIPYLEAKAARTTASKSDIIGGVSDLSEGPWAAATPVSEFYVMNTKELAPVNTKVRLLWDDENLYVGYENFDANIDGIIASDTAPDEWWASGADDDNETFITGHPAAATYYGFFNNSKGVKVEYSGPNVNSAYNGAWEAYTHVGEDRWNSIQVIPFSSIQVDPAITRALQGYFFRTYHGLEGFYGWGVGAVWSSSSFHPILLEE